MPKVISIYYHHPICDLTGLLNSTYSWVPVVADLSCSELDFWPFLYPEQLSRLDY